MDNDFESFAEEMDKHNGRQKCEELSTLTKQVKKLKEELSEIELLKKSRVVQLFNEIIEKGIIKWSDNPLFARERGIHRDSYREIGIICSYTPAFISYEYYSPSTIISNQTDLSNIFTCACLNFGAYRRSDDGWSFYNYYKRVRVGIKKGDTYLVSGASNELISSNDIGSVVAKAIYDPEIVENNYLHNKMTIMCMKCGADNLVNHNDFSYHCSSCGIIYTFKF